ncbi:hypothetical protein KIPB_015726, partial [Kipferlia bialata]
RVSIYSCRPSWASTSSRPTCGTTRTSVPGRRQLGRRTSDHCTTSQQPRQRPLYYFPATKAEAAKVGKYINQAAKVGKYIQQVFEGKVAFPDGQSEAMYIAKYV